MNFKEFYRKHRYIFILVFIILLSIFFRFWGINSLDIQHDAALNSVRAFAWFDFLTGLGQTSPIIWFGKIPWWGWLSFHDHPPGIFAIQYIFLNIFGQSSFALLLSSAIAGVLATYFIYYILNRLVGKKQALLASFLFSISSYAIWIVRTGYTEAVLSLFIVLSFIFFVLFIKEEKNKHWFYFVIFFSLTMLIKYTGIFLIAVAGIYILFFKRYILKKKFFWLANSLFLLIFSPVIIYNVMLWHTRGHLDAAFSSMLGMHPEDYSILLRGVNNNIFQNLWSFIINFYDNVSIGFFVLVLLSLIWLMVSVFKNKQDIFRKILLLNILFIILMFAFADTAPRFLTIILPFICISMALFICDIYQTILERKILKNIFVILIVFIFIFEIFYSINTNLLYNPVGNKGFTYSSHVFNKNGFNELDHYLRDNVYGTLPDKKKIEVLNEGVLNYNLFGREVILFDDRTHWNSQMWYIHRYQAHHDVPVVFLADAVRGAKELDINVFQYLLDAGVTGFWLVIAQEDSLIKGDMYYKNSEYNELIYGMVKELESSGLKPIKEIKNDQYNQSFFKVYNFYIK